MAGIQIGIASETKAFKQGIETGVIKPVEDAVDALDDLGKSRGPDKLEEGFKDAQKGSKDLKKEVERTADAIEKDFKSSYGEMKRSADDAFDKASEGAQDFKRESASTARESAASFSGEFDDVGDLVQETLANAFGGFGPVGAAAGIAAAAGLGVVLTEMGKQQEAADALKEKMAGMYQAAVEEGRTYLDESQILREIQDIMWNPERVDEYNSLVKDSKDLGLELATVLAANAGDRSKVEEVQTRINALLAEEMGGKEKLTALELAQGQIASDRYTITEQARDKYAEIAGLLDGNIAKAKDSKAVEEAYTNDQLEGIQRTRDASQSRWEAQATAIEKAKAKVKEIPTELPVKVVPDDRALRNYKPAPIRVTVDMFTRSGKRID